jgi:hypothetical protein
MFLCGTKERIVEFNFNGNGLKTYERRVKWVGDEGVVYLDNIIKTNLFSQTMNNKVKGMGGVQNGNF